MEHQYIKGGPVVILHHIAALVIASCIFAVPAGHGIVSAHAEDINPALSKEARIVLIGIGDSLTQGTADAANNSTGTLNAYLQKVADSLGQVMHLAFTQPLLDDAGVRLLPFNIPTNLGVDGSDIFSVEGIEYYKRAGTVLSYFNPDYFCKRIVPWQLMGDYEKVLYPINLLSYHPVSQIGSAIWLLNHFQWLSPDDDHAMVVFWTGNNDSSVAALGMGGANPLFIPIPLDHIDPEISPQLSTLLHYAQHRGRVSFSPYTPDNIERNLTALEDFATQYNHLLIRLTKEGIKSSQQTALFLLTLPYYSAVGYLFDSEDLEYYLRKVNRAYTVPPTFRRVVEPGQVITDFAKGDRVSLITFGFMYLLLHSGYPVDYVNGILETGGRQNDDLVLSEEEQQHIMTRIDGFNAAIKGIAAQYSSFAGLIDIGTFLNDTLTGKAIITVNNKTISRKWCRGGSFSLDGVHPGYTGHAIIANFVLEQMNEWLGTAAPLHDLSDIMKHDPYVDKDGDGWVSGPSYEASGLSDLLFLFKDPDDSDATSQPELPPDVWKRVSDSIMGGNI